MWSSHDDIILSAATYYINKKTNNKITTLHNPECYEDPPQFKLTDGDAYSKNCGKILITINNLLVFHCAFCNKEYGTLFNFLQHLSAKHSYIEEQIKKFEISAVTEHSKQTPATDLESFTEYEQIAESFESSDQSAEESNLSVNKRTKKTPTNKVINMAQIDERKEEIIERNEAQEGPLQIKSEIYHQDETSVSSLEDLNPPTSDSKSSDNLFKFKCDKCDKVFAKKIGLSIHILSHSNVQNYKCALCETAFKYKNNLQKHMLRHSNGKKYKCEHCDKRFFTNTDAAIHQRVHTGERPYVCFICGNGFKSSSNLAGHMKRHIGVRTKKCEICEKTFMDNFQLKNHMAGHSSERPFSCTHCSASFARNKTLKQHLKLHINAREYACTLCDKSFNQQPALLSHMNNNHKKLQYKSC